MDLDKMLHYVNNLNDYISASQEFAKHATNSKVQFNMSTILLLKKVTSLEIEYFNKYEGNGAALVLFEQMVEQPASKSWGMIGKELVLLLQYWLDAMRKHLIRHSNNWWIFLKQILQFINIIRTKDPSLPDILVESTTECLLDLATSSQPDILQRQQILWCLNLCCAESSREMRFALRNQLDSYFVKLASLLPSSGHLPTQYSILETLLRWLLPRQSVAVRQAAASKWFPEAVFGKRALELFMERPWMDFFQDARDFLNAYNQGAELVTSVLCRRVTLGTVAVVLGTEKRSTWLDINASDGSASVVLDKRLLDALGMTDTAMWETMLVTEENAISVQLFRQSSEVTLTFQTSRVPRLCPSNTEICGGCELKIVVSSAADLRRLDKALRQVFAHKYQILLDLDEIISLSPQENREHSRRLPSSLEEDTRFSHPAGLNRRKRAGFIVRPRNPVLWQSPSTASTTSLAQLHEKLESLPQYKFDKEAVHVCALPELSTVTEVSETDDRQSLLNSQTLKTNRPFGVCQKKFKPTGRLSRSDSEVLDKPKSRCLSPVDKHDDSTNCLLVATIGSADESVINDTLERLTKNKDFRSDNIVNLLVQEALEKDLNEREFLDSGINTGDNIKRIETNIEVNSEAIENTPLEKLNAERVSNKEHEKTTCTVISNTTTDESNDVVCETPKNFVTVRRRFAKTKIVKEVKEIITEETDEGHIFNEKAVEEFFSQHITQNKGGDIVISPTLARKINETSSESEQFEDCLMMRDESNVNDDQINKENVEMAECLNNMVDTVCNDFDKCTEILNSNTKDMDAVEEALNAIENPPDIIPLADVSNIPKPLPEKDPASTETKKAIKLKYTAKKTPKTVKTRSNAKKKINKLDLKATDVSPIKGKSKAQETNSPEINRNRVQSPKTDSPTTKSGDSDTPLIRRKRKLYSPNYENIDIEEDENRVFKPSKVQTPKYKSTCYKDIETERKRIRRPRVRKSRVSDTPSPRTKKKNEMFDQLKETLECPVTTIAADKRTERDIAIYNFTSDSEDEDFKKKKIEVQKRLSSTTIGSYDSTMSTRKGRAVNRVNYSENKSSDETVKKSTKPKRTVRRKRTPRIRVAKQENELIDEKMRRAEVPDELNTSIKATKHSECTTEDPQLVLAVNPEMEAIPDEVVTEIKDGDKKQKKTTKKQKKAEILSLKKDKVNNITLNADRDTDDRTVSPLPGLVIEAIPLREEDANDSVSANMLQRFRKIHENGPEGLINETNTTQNLLSDVERMNYSPIQMDITDELNKLHNEDSKTADDNTRSSSKSKAKETNINTKILRIKKEISEKNKSDSQDTPVVINLSDTKSEKSIATVGKSPITGHGDSDEEPPSSNLLTEKFVPRDLETEYLDQSMKDYFNRLRNVVQGLPQEPLRKNQSNDSVSTEIIANLDKDNSPVVSIKRMSFDDISKWLPSPRHSDTDTRCSTNLNDGGKLPSFTKNTQQSTCKDSDQETNTINKEIDQIATQFTDSTNKRSKKKKTKPILLQYTAEDIKDSSHISRNNSSSFKWLRSQGKIEPENDSEDDVTRNSNSKSTLKRTDIEKSKKSKKVEEKQSNRISTISPIRFFDEISNVNQGSPILRSKSIIKSISKDSSIEKQESVNEKQSSADECIDTRKVERSKKKLKANVEKASSIIESSIREPRQTSVDDKGGRRKRKSDSPDVVSSKRKKFEEAVTLSESGPSVSSVNEWFRRNVPVSRADSRDTTFRDSIHSVMEKLDTTLAEIHQNTSKKFIHLFVDAQSRLSDMRRERRDMLKSAASDILSQVVKVIDDKFAEFDRRSQEIHSEFTERLKAQASELIRDECAKKQVMVSLLREDLNATLARLQSN